MSDEYVTGIGRTVQRGKIHTSGMNRPDHLVQGCHYGPRTAAPLTDVIAVLRGGAGREDILAALLENFVKPSQLCKDCFPPRTMAAYIALIKAAAEAERAKEAAQA